MEIKIQARQSGKTYEIAQKMLDDPSSICIVHSLRMKDYFCKQYKINKNRVFIMHDIEKRLKGKKYSVVYIDEVGCCLDSIIRKVKYATHTNEY